MPRDISFLQELDREILDVTDYMVRVAAASLDPPADGEEAILQLGEELDGLYIRRAWALGFDYTRRLNLIKHAMEFDGVTEEVKKQLIYQAIRLDAVSDALLALVWVMIRDLHQDFWSQGYKIGMRQGFILVKVQRKPGPSEEAVAQAMNRLLERLVGGMNEEDDEGDAGPVPRKPQ